jgi:hypothetical protein
LTFQWRSTQKTLLGPSEGFRTRDILLPWKVRCPLRRSLAKFGFQAAIQNVLMSDEIINKNKTKDPRFTPKPKEILYIQLTIRCFGKMDELL